MFRPAVPWSIRYRWSLPATLVMATTFLATSAEAASLSLENLVFSEAGGDFTITGGERTSDALRIFQEVTGPDIDLFISIEGLRSSGFIGFRFESVLINRTDTPWIFFDHELQEQFQVPTIVSPLTARGK